MTNKIMSKCIHWTLRSAQVKNEYSYISSPPIRLRGVTRKNFILLPVGYTEHKRKLNNIQWDSKTHSTTDAVSQNIIKKSAHGK